MPIFAEKALPMAARGVLVFPCASSKAPLVAEGFKSATTDASKIKAWSRQHPGALVGMPTGGKTFVLDIDRHASKASGFDTLREKGWELPITRTHRTRSGGAHVFFKMPEGISIGSSAGKLGPGLDIRAIGGYVIRWDAEGYEVDNPKVVALPPPWLLDAVRRPADQSPRLFGIPDRLKCSGGGVDNSDLGNPDAPLGLTPQQITDALRLLDPDASYDAWLRVGLALAHETRGAGFAYWNEWSSKGRKYPGASALHQKWQSLCRGIDNPVTARSLLIMADKAQAHTPTTGVKLVCAADVQAVPVQWLWPHWIAKGKLTILAGDAGTGKTTLALALTATVTTGGQWPDHTLGGPVGNALVWSGEDDYADTIKPRMMAAGANMARVHFVESTNTDAGETTPFDPARDIPALELAILRIGGAALLIVDPIVSAVAGDMHRANDVRRSLAALVNLAEKQHCAVLGITHFSKGSTGASPQSRVIGSQAFAALARTVLVAAKQETAETRVLARAKNNLGLDTGGVSYTITPHLLENGIHTTLAVWGETVNGTAREILGTVEQPEGKADSALEGAKQFLLELLASGPVDSRQIKTDADGNGQSWSTIRRAKDELGTVVERADAPGSRGGSIYLWRLPLGTSAVRE